MLTEAVDLSNSNEARQEAARRVGQLLQDHAEKIWADQVWQMDVTDDVDLILFVVNITAMKSAATTDYRVR